MTSGSVCGKQFCHLGVASENSMLFFLGPSGQIACSLFGSCLKEELHDR